MATYDIFAPGDMEIRVVNDRDTWRWDEHRVIPNEDFTAMMIAIDAGWERERALRTTLTSAYSMLSLMRYRSSASFDGSVGLPDLREADEVLGRCRAALAETPEPPANREP